MRFKILLLLLFSIMIFSCKKEEGKGGMATIKGKVWVHDWDKNFNLPVYAYEYAGLDEDVFIVYGDQNGYGDKVSTDLNGNFEFNYLRKGDYTIYALSDTIQSDSFSNNQIPVIVKVHITEKKQVVDVGTITVNR